MNLRSRKTIFYLYILLFLLVAPVVVLYTAGFRVNLTTRQLVQVGALSITSTPRSVLISLDAKRVAEHTPAILKRVLPGSYELVIEKPGYHTWQREIDVTSRQTTMIENVVLFKESQSQLVLAIEPSLSAASPNGEQVVYGVISEPWFELWLYRPRDASWQIIDRLASSEITDPRLTWTADGKMIQLLSWQHQSAQEHFYSLTGNGIAKQDSFSNFRLTSSDDGIIVDRLNDKKTIALPPQGNYTIIDEVFPFLFVRQEHTNALIVIDQSTDGPPIIISTEALFYRMYGTRMLYSDGVELHLIDLATSRDQLITRTGAGIIDAHLYPQGSLILLVNAEGASALDFHDPEALATTPLLTAETIQSFWMDERGKEAFWIGSFEGKTGLFTFPLL